MAEQFDSEGISHSADLPAIAQRYFEIKKSGKEWKALCPFHADTNPSATLYEKGGKWRFKCFACGESHDAISFVMAMESCDFPTACRKITNGGNGVIPATPLQKAPLRITTKPPADCLPPPFATKQGEPLHIYPYLDANRELLGYGALYPGDDEPQYWTWGSRSEADPPRWEKKPFSHPTPLFGLESLAARPTAQVLITGGERSAEAAATLFPGMVVATWCNGIHAFKHADWSVLAGRKVVLAPDNDAAGRQAMSRLAVMLWEVGVIEIKGIDTSTYDDNGASVEAPEGHDLADEPYTNYTPDQALAWAKARLTVYEKPQAEAPEAATIAQDEPDAPPDADALTQPESPSPAKRRKESRPVLGVVDGNTVRAPRVQEIDPSADLPPAYSEDALAEAFTLGPGQDWRYTAAWGVWHKWTGQRWEEDVKKQVTWEARNVCREKSNEPGDLTKAGRQKIATLKMVNSVLGLAGADPRHATAPNDWDADPWLLGTPSGVIDLKTGHLTETERAHLISKSTGIGPQQAETPLWSSILARTSGGDASYAQYLQRWAGYMLTGDTREECFLFIYGVGGSGKSTFVKVLTEIMGDYAVSAPIESFTATDRKEHSTEIARLAGARLVAANETEDGARWNESRIKALTGRDKIAARKMNRDFFEFKPQFKLLFIGNHKPALRSVGEEMKRRIHMVEFPQSIPAEERDLTLKDKLVAEYPAILQWMIEGCLAWQDYGLGEPEQVTKAVSEYLEGEDTLGAWAEECIDLAAISRTAAGDAYRSFVRWAEAAGEYVPSQKRFSQRLEDRGFTRVRSGGTRYFQGFSLRLTGNSGSRSYGERDC